ncbi:MAG: glycine zipper domain-containing protein [Ferruginibacter sp.]
MKKIFSILALVTTLAACKTKVNTADNKNMVLVDTTSLSKYNLLVNVGNDKFVAIERPVEPLYVEPVNSTPVKKASISKRNNNSSNTVYSSGTSTVSNASYPQDKGWSHAAKGTAVGGGSGAILGAIVNKNNRLGGAIVGSVIGAGTGYLIGRSKDRKSGRVARAKARKNGY